MALAVAASALIPAAEGALGATEPGTPTAAGGAKTRLAWHGCGEQLECARVRVPLDWDHPQGRQIKLAVIRHLASRPGKRIGSLFINFGGPAGSVDRVRSEGEMLDAVGRGRFDVVGWDLRGAGDSTRVRCFRSRSSWERFFADWALPIPATTQAQRFVRKTRGLTRRCGQLSGGLLSTCQVVTRPAISITCAGWSATGG